MTNLFATLDNDQLSTVSGGASRSKLVLDQLDSKFGSDGVVSYIGKPSFKPTDTAGVSRATGKFDTNALWGGDTQRSFSALVDSKHQSVSGLHTSVLGSK
jgi:hypothetical protein